MEGGSHLSVFEINKKIKKLNNEINEKDKNINEERIDIKIKEEINKIENNFNYIYYHCNRDIYDLFKIETYLKIFNIMSL